MNCPQCNERALTKGGGGFTTAGRTRYYTCRGCDIVFSEVGGVISIRETEPLPFRNRREALRVLYQAIRDDREWFGAVTEETEAMARLVFTTYLIGNRSRPAARREHQVSIRRGVGRAALRIGH